MKRGLFIVGMACLLISCKGSSGKKARAVVGDGVPNSEAALAELPDSFYKPTSVEQGPGVCTDDIEPVVEQESPLSVSFLNNCGGCHGTAGQGGEKGEFPPLRHVSNEESFIRYVRNGGSTMPGFPADIISDADLAKDFKVLSSKQEIPEIDTRAVPLLPMPNLTDDSYDAIMRKGLLAWRTPGERGGCVSCHGPDGIDLARIDYPNAAMLRRARGQDLPGEKAIDIVRMIAAQRWRYQITKPCRSKALIPFQPGNKVLSGTAAERDGGLLTSLAEQQIDFKTAMTSATTAADFTSKIAALDVNKIPVGFRLNRWTEDFFHGDEHSSTAEWMPEIPMEPKDNEKTVTWVRLQNAYMKDPSDENLWKLMDGTSLLDGRRFIVLGVSGRIASEKYSSVLLSQHMMRFNRLTFPDLTKTTNYHRFNVWETAQISNVMARGCADSGDANDPFPCWKYPASFYKKMGTDRDRLLSDVLKIDYPWLVAGWLLEPSLQLTEEGAAQMEHLHQAAEKHLDRFEGQEGAYNQLPLHDAYFSYVRLVKSVEVPDERLPFASGLKVKPVKGCWNKAGNGIKQWVEQTLPQIERHVDAAKTPAIAVEHKTAVEQSVKVLNQALLYRIRAAAQAPDARCEALKEDAFTTKTAVEKIAAWHTKMQWQDATITSLSQEIQGLLK